MRTAWCLFFSLSLGFLPTIPGFTAKPFKSNCDLEFFFHFFILETLLGWAETLYEFCSVSSAFTACFISLHHTRPPRASLSHKLTIRLRNRIATFQTWQMFSDYPLFSNWFLTRDEVKSSAPKRCSSCTCLMVSQVVFFLKYSLTPNAENPYLAAVLFIYPLQSSLHMQFSFFFVSCLPLWLWPLFQHLESPSDASIASLPFFVKINCLLRYTPNVTSCQINLTDFSFLC